MNILAFISFAFLSFCTINAAPDNWNVRDELSGQRQATMGTPASQKKVDVPVTRVQPLWFGVQIPPDANGRYRSQVTVTPANAGPLRVDIFLTVKGEPVKNGGFDKGKSLSRLAWLNATLGMNDKTTRDFMPVERNANQIRMLAVQLISFRSS